MWHNITRRCPNFKVCEIFNINSRKPHLCIIRQSVVESMFQPPIMKLDPNEIKFAAVIHEQSVMEFLHQPCHANVRVLFRVKYSLWSHTRPRLRYSGLFDKSLCSVSPGLLHISHFRSPRAGPKVIPNSLLVTFKHAVKIYHRDYLWNIFSIYYYTVSSKPIWIRILDPKIVEFYIIFSMRLQCIMNYCSVQPIAFNATVPYLMVHHYALTMRSHWIFSDGDILT